MAKALSGRLHRWVHPVGHYRFLDVYPTELMPKDLAVVWSGRSALGKPTVSAHNALVAAFEVQLEPGQTAGRTEIVWRT